MLKGPPPWRSTSYDRYVSKTSDQAFDAEHRPGATTPYSGLYRCMGCGKEDVSTEGHPLPPQNHHQHTQAQGAILWRLAVFADHRQKG